MIPPPAQELFAKRMGATTNLSARAGMGKHGGRASRRPGLTSSCPLDAIATRSYHGRSTDQSISIPGEGLCGDGKLRWERCSPAGV